MFRNRGWLIILLLVIASALVILFFGEHLLSTAWGSVLLNLISGLYFVVIVVVVFGAIYRRTLYNTLSFFGVQHGSPLQIYISTHLDPHTRTGAVQTAAERQAADELRKALSRQFPEALDFWADRFGFSPQAPEIIIEGSPLEHVDNWPYDGGLILIGGPTRNSLTEFVLRTCSPPLTFNDEKKVFLIRRAPQEQYRELDNSHRLAVLEKLHIGNRVVIIAFGFGEIETCISVRHLIAEWKVLLRKRPNEQFARLLLLQDNGQVRVQEELSYSVAG